MLIRMPYSLPCLILLIPLIAAKDVLHSSKNYYIENEAIEKYILRMLFSINFAIFNNLDFGQIVERGSGRKGNR
jgi:hypothetical protein